MSDQEIPGGPLPPAEDEPPVFQVVRKTTRFSKEVVATMIALASAAFGVVAALAWNSAVTEAFDQYFKNAESRISALFVYAFAVTLVGVVVIVLLGRLAARIQAQPVEFKYPSVPKTG